MVKILHSPECEYFIALPVLCNSKLNISVLAWTLELLSL